MSIADLARSMFDEQSFDEHDIHTYITVLTESDKLFHNDGEPFLTDAEYDFIYRYAEKISPSHVYFTGVGSEVRGGKVKLPYPMGSLDQVYIGNIKKWVDKYNIEKGYLVVLTDKLDGASAMIIYGEDGELQIGYSRGNGLLGADWTRHLKLLDTVPQNVGRPMVIRAEVIIEKASFDYLKTKVKTRAGKEYKNPRNMVAGLMNSSENKPIVYDYIRFIAYQIVDGIGSKQEQLDELSNLGFTVVHSLCVYAHEMNDESLSDHLNLRRQDSLFEIDGLVIDVDDEKKRSEMNPTRDTLNPAYSIKYKVADADNIAFPIVLGVEWNISKHMIFKPRVNIEPVDIGGVTISWLTGFNAQFILDNNIGPGTELEITRAGDVIPFIQSVITSTKAQMPDSNGKKYDWDWSATRVDAVAIYPELFNEVAIKSMTDFFTKIEVPLLKEGSIQKLYDEGYCNVRSIIVAEKPEMVDVLGKNGIKIYDGLHKVLSDIPLYKIIGAYSTQRGIGVRRMKKIQTWYEKNQIDLLENVQVDFFKSIDGFDEITANAVKRAIDEFLDLYDSVEEFITLNHDSLVSYEGGLTGHKICMTGFRDKELSDSIEKAGGTIQSSVSGKTTILITKDPTSTTGKAKKARDFGIPVMGVDEFTSFMNEQ